MNNIFSDREHIIARLGEIIANLPTSCLYQLLGEAEHELERITRIKECNVADAPHSFVSGSVPVPIVISDSCKFDDQAYETFFQEYKDLYILLKSRYNDDATKFVQEAMQAGNEPIADGLPIAGLQLYRIYFASDT